jgi:hypothetical protein
MIVALTKASLKALLATQALRLRALLARCLRPLAALTNASLKALLATQALRLRALLKARGLDYSISERRGRLS